MKNLQNKLEELGVEIISTPTFFSKSHIIIKKDSYYEVSELFKNSDIRLIKDNFRSCFYLVDFNQKPVSEDTRVHIWNIEWERFQTFTSNDYRIYKRAETALDDYRIIIGCTKKIDTYWGHSSPTDIDKSSYLLFRVKRNMKAILAVNNLGFIGLRGGLPWIKHTEDFKLFKKLTKDQTLLVGYNTFQTLPNLKGRTIVQDSDNVDFDSIDWCIGGKYTYEKYAHLFTELHVSHIDNDTIGDTLFPDFSKLNPNCQIFNYNFNYY